MILPFIGASQNNTFSPYSRYGLGELGPTTLSHNQGMGGAFIAHKPDSTMPIFINTGSPASYALIRLTTLEVGGNYVYSVFQGNSSSLKKWGTNFSYGALGFPVRGNGGACFGIMPYSHVGYDTKSRSEEPGVGTVEYKFSGTGGLNKAFIGYGIMPFNKRLVKFRTKYLNIPDSLKRLSKAQFAARHFGSKLLSDFSVGFNVNYIFGNIVNNTHVIYPNSVVYNYTRREQVLNMGDFTGNFGVQTGITIDSVRNGKSKRVLQERIKFTFGYFMTINNPLKVNYTYGVYNYILTAAGQEWDRDTVVYQPDQKNTITLPVDQGFGIGFKKAEKLNIVADFAITDWQKFKYLDAVNNFKNNYRVSIGANFVPEKYASGRNAFLKRINYRLGLSYQTGYISVNNTVVSNYFISAGIGVPVGINRSSAMVNISAQYGQTGTTANSLIKENYWRIHFGFTFSDRWFQKFRYD
jgi:hypothetical protein